MCAEPRCSTDVPAPDRPPGPSAARAAASRHGAGKRDPLAERDPGPAVARPHTGGPGRSPLTGGSSFRCRARPLPDFRPRASAGHRPRRRRDPRRDAVRIPGLRRARQPEGPRPAHEHRGRGARSHRDAGDRRRPEPRGRAAVPAGEGCGQPGVRRPAGRHQPQGPALGRALGHAGGQRRRALLHVPHLCQRHCRGRHERQRHGGIHGPDPRHAALQPDERSRDEGDAGLSHRARHDAP
ncbi:modular polyketide synthase (plasmid) [Cereibacter sphaeroides KD131]|nr:modular polyketide synthase [Cereibacter sphaeroides KD131]